VSSCYDSVSVQQRGNRSINIIQQVLFPDFNFSCYGRITGITASMEMKRDNGTDPSLEVWRPQSAGIGVFNKVGEVKLLQSKVIPIGTGSDQYLLLNMSLNEYDMIEFKSGDVVGYHQPNDTRYAVWAITTAGGYTGHGNIFEKSSSKFDLDDVDYIETGIQLLMQFSIGTYAT